MIWQDVLAYTITPAVAGFLFALIVRGSRILFAAAFLAPLLILALIRWRELHGAILIHQDFEAIFYLTVHYLMIALSACLGGYLALHFRESK